jgi:hypothetical protein
MLLVSRNEIHILVNGVERTEVAVIEGGEPYRARETMHALMIVLALSAAGLMGLRLFKERKRVARGKARRRRQDEEAKQNWRASYQRALRDSPN